MELMPRVSAQSMVGFAESQCQPIRSTPTKRVRSVAPPAREFYNVYIIRLLYTPLRTNIVIDDRLMEESLRVTGLTTKKEVVELALRTLLRLGKQARIRRARGKLDWQGDLDAMRTDK